MGSPLRHELNALLNQYRTALQRDPDNPILLADVGGILRKLGRRVEALACYRDAAQAYLEAGKIQEAARTCGRILRIDPEDHAGRALVARIQQGGGMDAESLEQALSGARKQRVADGPPVVVLPPGADEALEEGRGPLPEEQGCDETIERPMPPMRPLDDVPTLFEDGAAPDDEPTMRAPAVDPAAETGQRSAAGGQQEALPSDLFPAELVQGAARHRVASGESIIVEGDPGRDLFVLLRGKAEVSKRVSDDRRVVIETVSSGAFFGELGLLGDGKRHATVTALEASEVLLLDQRSLRAQLKSAPALNRALIASYRARLQRMLLAVAPLFAAMSDDEAGRVLSQCKPVRRRAGDVALQAGARSPGVYLILLGVVGMQGARTGVLTDGGIFGVEPLIQGQPSASSYVCETFCQLLLWPEAAVLSHAAERPDLLELLGAASMI